MTISVKWFGVAAIVLGFAVGCGGSGNSNGGAPLNGQGGQSGQNGSTNNVQACQNFYNSIQCGSYDPSQYTSTCSNYSNTTCDLSSYFDCLKNSFQCNNGKLDTSGWASCASKATCNSGAGGSGNTGTGGSGNTGTGGSNSGTGGSSGGTDNVQACQNFYNSIQCGSFDPSQYTSTCSNYASTSCSLVPYFDCLKNTFQCNNGTPDTSGWSNCASKATCP